MPPAASANPRRSKRCPWVSFRSARACRARRRRACGRDRAPGPGRGRCSPRDANADLARYEVDGAAVGGQERRSSETSGTSLRASFRTQCSVPSPPSSRPRGGSAKISSTPRGARPRSASRAPHRASSGCVSRRRARSVMARRPPRAFGLRTTATRSFTGRAPRAGPAAGVYGIWLPC